MTLALCILLGLSLAAVAALSAYLYSNRGADRGIARYVRLAVVVHTTEGQSIKGVLLEEFTDVLVLVQAEYLHGEDGTSLAGKILLPRSKVAFLQVVSPPAEAAGA